MLTTVIIVTSMPSGIIPRDLIIASDSLEVEVRNERVANLLIEFFFLPFFLHINEGGKIIKLHVVIYTFQKKRISKGEEVSRSNKTSSLH